MRILLLAAAIAAAPSFPAGELNAPKGAPIGSKGCSGQVRMQASFSGFGRNPVVNVSASATGVRIVDLVRSVDAKGAGTIDFSVAYSAAAPGKFFVQVMVNEGAGGFEKHQVRTADIELRRYGG